MRVVVACEYSGVVSKAFRDRGHTAVSVDLLPTEGDSQWHFQRDIFEFLEDSDPFDIMIAHPPCTYLAVSGARWWKDRQDEQVEALSFVQHLMDVPIPKICIENPISRISTAIRKPDQIIQPWQFGHGESKATCLWLKNLPPLSHTSIVSGREQRVHLMSPGPNRWRERSRTYKGIAEAMASQWG